MKTIYLPIVEQLNANVSELKWIDADNGQLDFYDTKPPVAFPCALIDIDLPQCIDLSRYDQQCDVEITVRWAFLPQGQSNHAAPTSMQDVALANWAVIDKGFDCLQGFSGTEFSPMGRASQITEKRDDGLKVIKQVWKTTFMASVTE